MVYKKVLLVEGTDDLHVYYHLLRLHDITVFREKVAQNQPGILIESSGGIDKLIKEVSTHAKRSGLEQLGIVIDADKDLKSNWKKLRNKLRELNYSVADEPDPTGTVVEHDFSPNVGVWIMPNNVQPGMLEDFVSTLVPKGNTLWAKSEECLQQVLQQIPPEKRFSKNHYSKAHMCTWLAWQNPPGMQMGIAISQGLLNIRVPDTQPFVAWIRRLYALPHG